MPYQLTIETLEDGWQDRDYIMLHACFQCLVDCVEKEKLLLDNRDWTRSNETQAAHEELASLYAWWKAKMAANETHSGMSDAEDESYKADSAMLLRLLSVRRYLWT